MDPSEKLIEVHLAALKWNIQQRRFGLTDKGCVRLHEMSVELLDLLKSNMPDKTGEASGWKLEKAHSILHKVKVYAASPLCSMLYNMLCNNM